MGIFTTETPEPKREVTKERSTRTATDLERFHGKKGEKKTEKESTNSSTPY